jgi:hypothetical protein
MSELKTCFKRVDYDLSGLLHGGDRNGLHTVALQALLGGFAAELYKIVSTPTTFLLTPGGAIAFRGGSAGSEWSAAA